jgi:hypothetical protein
MFPPSTLTHHCGSLLLAPSPLRPHAHIRTYARLALSLAPTLSLLHLPHPPQPCLNRVSGLGRGGLEGSAATSSAVPPSLLNPLTPERPDTLTPSPSQSLIRLSPIPIPPPRYNRVRVDQRTARALGCRWASGVGGCGHPPAEGLCRGPLPAIHPVTVGLPVGGSW